MNERHMTAPPQSGSISQGKETAMPVAVIVDVPGGNQQLYEQLRLFPEGKLPEGRLMRLAGPAESRWRVVNIEPSQEQFEDFARDQLEPAARQAGDPPAEITFFPVCRLIRK